MSAAQLSLRPRPPYLLGLLCVIPFLGFIAGILIVLTGIYRYKDKGFITIGISGIIFTAVYALLLYSAEYGTVGRQGFTALSKVQLNTLVEKIEFFHSKNGQYPERLEELQEIDPFAPIVDPLQMHNKSDSVNFNYYKIENRYTVFSSGVDGQAGTEDDFYPEIQVDSTSKVGLILKDPHG